MVGVLHTGQHTNTISVQYRLPDTESDDPDTGSGLVH